MEAEREEELSSPSRAVPEWHRRLSPGGSALLDRLSQSPRSPAAADDAAAGEESSGSLGADEASSGGARRRSRFMRLVTPRRK